MSTIGIAAGSANGAHDRLPAQPSKSKANPEHDPFLRVNPEGRLIYANDSAWMVLRTLGWQGKTVPEPFLATVKRVCAQPGELRMEVPCGTDLYSFRVVPGYRGYFISFSGTRVDQTSALRQTLHESQAFAHSVAHDLRGPLRAIRAWTEATLAECEPNLGPKAEALKHVKAATARLDQFLDGLLELSKSSLRDLEFQTIDVVALLRNLIQQHPQWRPPYARVQLPSAAVPVRGDLVSLTQCVSNLLSNAIKFVEAGTQPQVLIESHQNGPITKIIFADNGIGIPKDDLAALFTPLYRSRSSLGFEGTGLGLAIVQKAVTRMGGRVGVESEPGKGSRFWLELPTSATVVANGRHHGNLEENGGRIIACNDRVVPSAAGLRQAQRV